MISAPNPVIFKPSCLQEPAEKHSLNVSQTLKIQNAVMEIAALIIFLKSHDL